MNSDQALSALAGHFGILPSFHDMSGQEYQTERDSQIALLRANGLVLDNDAMIFEALHLKQHEAHQQRFPEELIVTSATASVLDVGARLSWSITAEGTSQHLFNGIGDDRGIALPPLASGFYDLTIEVDNTHHHILLIAAPRRLPSLQDVTGSDRIWGMNTALYGLRSEQNFGFGDFTDLGMAAQKFAGVGAGFLGINPVHALGWSAKDTISPYSPSHRGYLNTLHIGHGAGIPPTVLSDVERALAEMLRDADQLDYPKIWALNHEILDRAYQAFCGAGAVSAAFDQFCGKRGDALTQFATFEAISEDFGPDWRQWPVELRDPHGAAVANSVAKHADRVQFHRWLQWVAHDQLAQAQVAAKTAGMSLGLYLDLAVGPRRGGAEAWCEQDLVAQGVSIGAPPDHLSPAGQNWDLTAFSPHKMRRSKYAHFRRVLADTMDNAGVMRIDHILGMNRSFWIPDDGSRGAYIKQPFEAFLAIIAIEAERSGTVVIGEDLGLVPDGFREVLADRGLYSYSVLQYEKGYDGQYYSTEHLRPQSLACFSTHDTPTLRGFWTGRDIDWWKRLNWIDDDQAGRLQWERGGERGSLLSLSETHVDEHNIAAVSDHIHRQLARSPAAMVSVQLDDVLALEEAQNLPGTIDEHPNWRRRCPEKIDDFTSDPRIARIGELMGEHGRNQTRSIPQEELVP